MRVGGGWEKQTRVQGKPHDTKMRAEDKEKVCFLHTKAVAQLSEVGMLTKTNPRGGLLPEGQAVHQARQTAGPSPGEQPSVAPSLPSNHQRQVCLWQTGICIPEEEMNLCSNKKFP